MAGMGSGVEAMGTKLPILDYDWMFGKKKKYDATRTSDALGRLREMDTRMKSRQEVSDALERLLLPPGTNPSF